ncbi:S8 family serine peptidase [Solirubrobacter sp. CPCC 204708]|uniref:S8 family serine peptidase n=1 Tax=Solirubrobacter deserti TaxID=2282478 RepID=A0ABT4RDM6_9ACTN|nr:S8 family serine peptidase [Solirubrobacter deserti]MBE2314611.1 S8 family serine peptidase [Solirubrobacter deserti]MDA0136618.1 S8 family serine peptidase [Solirubrobacter deserti]
MPPKKPRASKRSASTKASAFPDLIYAQASPRSIGGGSLFDAGSTVTAANVGAYVSDARVLQAAVTRLQEAGFRVLQVAPTTINIAAPRETYEEAFGTTLVTEEREVLKPGQNQDTATYIDCPETAQSGLIDVASSRFADVLEGVAIEEPMYPMQNAFAPLKSYWHLRVPGDVSLGVNADRAHRAGVTGRNVKLVMVDSGWFAHPYFTQRGYRSSPVVLGPAAVNPAADESGHGTGESANAFAVAPDIDFTMVKINFVNSVGAFNAAVNLAPHIISCSWGSSQPNGPLSAANQALAAAISAAVAGGIIVVFSAGNGHWGFPGQHPDVISAGGVFLQADGSTRASDYASGFQSNIYPGRGVPDASGLVGMRPGAKYIMLPVEGGDAIDVDGSGGTHPNGDETTNNDGWAAFSGTSAAAPQIAGVCALIREACGRLTPAEVKDVIRRTARDVTAGRNHPNFNHPAGAGYDLATGAGLVDAHRAVLMARVRCLRAIGPVPITPGPIVGPQPIGPQPINPGPIGPQPIGPGPIGPQPIGPGPGPINPGPIGPAGHQGLSAEDADAIEELLVNDEIDFGE